MGSLIKRTSPLLRDVFVVFMKTPTMRPPMLSVIQHLGASLTVVLKQLVNKRHFNPPCFTDLALVAESD